MTSPRTHWIGGSYAAACGNQLHALPPLPLKERLVMLIQVKPGITSGDLARELNVSTSAVKHSLERLLARNVVSCYKALQYRQVGTTNVNHWFFGAAAAARVKTTLHPSTESTS